MKIKQKKPSSEKGQSLLEFVIALFGYLVIVLMVVQVALGFGVANYIQYATFMSARAYLSGHVDANQKKQAAQTVLEGMVGSFTTIVKPADEESIQIGPSPRIVSPSDSKARKLNWEYGTRYRFKMKLYMFPLIGSALPGKGWVTLQSESLLGSEPSEIDCSTYMQNQGGNAKRMEWPAAEKRYLPIGGIDNGC